MPILSSILGGVGALGSAIYGAVASSKANNRARQLIQQQRDDNKRWYDTKMNQDYTLRTDVQNAINRQRELLDEQYKRARATNVVSGGSEESVALQKEAANKALADTTADIAAAGANYKDQVEQQYRAQDAALNQQQAQSYQQQAAQTAAAASQAVNAGLNMVGQGIAAATPKSASTPVQRTGPVSSEPTYTAEQLAQAQQTIPSPKPILTDEQMNAIRKTKS